MIKSEQRSEKDRLINFDDCKVMTEEELSPRERRYQRTQKAILDAALAIVTKEGADKLSIRAIADRIDYSPAGLYEYYGSKEEIIGALCWEGHRTLKRYMQRVPFNMPPDEYMVEIGLAYISFAIQNPDYFMLIFTAPIARPDHDIPGEQVPSEKMMAEDSSFPLLVNGVARAAEAGIIRLLPELGILETAYAFWAIVHGAAMLRVGHLNYIPGDFAAADKAMIKAFVKGMGS